jgi:hypothetical protein
MKEVAADADRSMDDFHRQGVVERGTPRSGRRIKMSSTTRSIAFAFSALLVLGVNAGASAQQANMTFFVTSAGPGKGADLGGLAGADRLCQQFAQAVGAGSHTWHAYLSTQAADGQTAINARDRIGRGPWQNSKGVTIAKDVDELHGANNLTKQTALTEKGDVVNGRADTPKPIPPTSTMR